MSGRILHLSDKLYAIKIQTLNQLGATRTPHFLVQQIIVKKGVKK